MELERVVKDLSSSSSYAPKETRHFYFLAKVFKQSLDYASAIYSLRYVLRLDPNHHAARAHLAVLLMKHGQEKMCEAALAQQRGLSGKHCDQLYSTARVYFDECLIMLKSNPRVWMFKGVCHVHLGETNDALDALSRGIHYLAIEVRTYTAWTDKRLENDSKGKPERQVERLRRQRVLSVERHNRNTRMLCEMYVLRGKLYWAAGSTDAGNRDLRLASTLQADHPEVLAFGALSFRKVERLYNQAVELFQQREHEEALKLIDLALEISAEDIKLHILQSKLLRALKRLPAAFSAIQRATELFTKASQFDMKVPEDITRQTNLVFNDMAIQCAGKGEYEKSIALLNKVIASEKKLSRGLADVNFRFYVNRGDCYRVQHELQAAAADYLVALQQNPPQDEEFWAIKTRLSLTYYLLATDLFNDSDFASADAALTQAIANNPKVAAYYGTRGTCRYYLGAYGEAYEDYRQCLELDPGNEEVRLKLQHQYEKSADPQSSSSSSSGKTGGHRLRREDIVSSGGVIDTKRHVFEVMSKLKPSPSDAVAMMLHPRQTHALPDIHKMIKSASTAALHAHAAAVGASPLPLPLVNPRLTTAFLASQDVVQANEKVRAVLGSKYDTSKGAMWSALRNAKNMALARCKPASGGGAAAAGNGEGKGKRKDRGKGKAKEVSYTSAGLKRRSEEASKEAMLKYKDDESFIAGVITSYDDPFMLATDEPSKKVNLIIKVSGGDGTARRRYQTADDLGGAGDADQDHDLLDSASSVVTNPFDADRAAWHRSRAQGDGSSVTDELIQQLTRPPPQHAPEGGSGPLNEDGHEGSSLSDDGSARAKPKPSAAAYAKESFLSASLTHSSSSARTANKFGTRRAAGGAGGAAGSSRGAGGGGGLRVRFSTSANAAAKERERETETDEPGEDENGDGCEGGGYFDGGVGLSRVAQLLAEHEGVDNHVDLFGSGFSFEAGEESSLLAMTEEEELQQAAQLRAEMQKKEQRAQRDKRRAEVRKKMTAEAGSDDDD